MELLGGLVELGPLGLEVDHAQRDFEEPSGLLTISALEPDAAAPRGRLRIAQHFSAGSKTGTDQVPIGTAETDCRRFLPRAHSDTAPGGARRSRRRKVASEGSVEFSAIFVPCGRLCGVNAALRGPTQHSSVGLSPGHQRDDQRKAAPSRETEAHPNKVLYESTAKMASLHTKDGRSAANRDCMRCEDGAPTKEHEN